jgi:SAM-dependent methyltransferase
MSSSELSLGTDFAHNGSAESKLNFGEEYYRFHLGPESYDRSNVGLVNFFAVVADQIIRSLQPRTVLDAGCAMGFLVEALWDRGIEARGVDISEYAIARVRRDIRPYCRVASLTEPIDGTYDLIVCIEVLEHMPTADALQAIDRLTAATDSILFSSSATDMEESTHVNVRQPIWWLDQFQQRGFVPDLMFDAGFVTPQAMLIRRNPAVLDWQMRRLFCEWLRYKNALAERDRNAETLTTALTERQAAVAGLTAQVATMQLDHQTARETAQHRYEAAEQERQEAGVQLTLAKAQIETLKRDYENARETERQQENAVGQLTETLAGSRAECMTLAQKAAELEDRLSQREGVEIEMRGELRAFATVLETISNQQLELTSRIDRITVRNIAPGEEKGFGETAVSEREKVAGGPEEPMARAAVEELISRHALLLTTLEDLAQQRDQLLRSIELKPADRANPRVAYNDTFSDDRLSDLAQQVSRMNGMQQALQASVSSLKTQVSDILSSRIWKTLVAIGGSIQRLLPGRPH